MASDNPTQVSLDIEISHHEREIFRLKRCRNAATPVALLPPELLGKIFCEGSLLEKLDLNEPGKRMAMPLCVRLTHVSSSWRVVALGCPELWSLIQVRTGTPAPLLEYMYDNSKGALLSLDVCDLNIGGIPGDLEVLDAVVRVIQEGAQRFKSLAFHTELWPLQRIFKDFRGELVSLERLKIVGLRHRTLDLGQTLATIAQAAQLRTLSIAPPFSIPTTTTLLLKSDRLVNVEISLTSNAADALAFLRSAHNIKRLLIHRLDHAESLSPVADPLGSTIDLPSLEYLALGYELRQLTVLRALRVPNARVHLDSSYVKGDDLYPLISQLPRTLGLDFYGVIAPREVWVSWRDVEVWEERLLRWEEWSDARRREAALALDMVGQHQSPLVVFPFPLKPMSDVAIFSLDNWSFSSLNVMTIGGTVSRAFWDFLARLDTLEVLRVLVGADEFTEAINDIAAPFPSLKALLCSVLPRSLNGARTGTIDVCSIFRMSLERAKEERLVNQLRLNWASALDVRNLLLRRDQQSTPLEMIEFLNSGCGIQPDALAVFSDVTAEVKWKVSQYCDRGGDNNVNVHVRF